MVKRKTPTPVEEIEDFDDLDEEEEERAPKPASKSSTKKFTGISATMVAEKLSTAETPCDPKTFRAWLRRAVQGNEEKLEEFGLDGREGRERYSWDKWTNPGLKAVMKAWGESSHKRGGGAGRKKGTAKKAPAKKKTTRKKASS